MTLSVCGEIEIAIQLNSRKKKENKLDNADPSIASINPTATGEQEKQRA
jgi:hypothetical protein